MDLSQSRTIKGYELIERIGEGAYGEVYRARQQFVEREVAIKIILPQFANQPEFIRRFETEAQLVAQLEHLHIVPLYDYWRDPEGAYLVMRLMKGGSLADSIAQHGPWEPRATANLLNQVASALDAAHRKGVIHRDLKPANILLDEDGNAYLSDFGIAKAVGAQAGQTATGAIVGTPAYISPEQAQSLPLAPQTDIYTLGVTLYELLTGEHPFPDTPTGALLLKHVSQPLPLVHDSFTELPIEIDNLVQKATAKDPAARYADALSLAADFRRALRLEIEFPVTPQGELTNPFKGLRAFQESDSKHFFGRAALTTQLVEMLGEEAPYASFLAVVGPSGSGKSSVVKAGLLPALRQGALPGSER
ncbi:MAG: serine/threonine-protein kinase PknK, partial [Chloroflexota bacterium]